MKAKKKTDVGAKKGHERTPLTGVFSINPDNLQKEQLRQLELMEEYGELSAEAVYQEARLEERKKTLRSKLIIDNEGKARNALVAEALYRTDPEYISVCKALLEATYRRELMQNAMFALAQRNKLIEMMSIRQVSSGNVGTEIQLPKGMRSRERSK